MTEPNRLHTRRRFLRGMTCGVAGVSMTRFLSVPGLFAQELMLTAAQEEGPVYPDHLPLDTDNDLLVLNDSIKPAVGEITHLTGRILSPSGTPVRNALVEIWEADAEGNYIHTRGHRDTIDKNFQGFGRLLTGSKGEYYFRTIKPVAYGPRAPHIHYAIKIGGKRMLTTSLYVKGARENAADGPLRQAGDARDKLIVDFKPIKESKIGELAANFDVADDVLERLSA